MSNHVEKAKARGDVCTVRKPRGKSEGTWGCVYSTVRKPRGKSGGTWGCVIVYTVLCTVVKHCNFVMFSVVRLQRFG